MNDMQIREVSSGVYQGKYTTNENENAFFICEKIETEDQVKFWKGYALDTKDATLLGANKVEAEVGFNKKVSVIQKISDPASQTLDLCAVSDSVNQIYIIYASKFPVTKRLYCEKSNFLPSEKSISLDEYKERYDNILMSYVLKTKDRSKTTTHMGIFRNPISFIEDSQKYKGLSMPLHGFGATIAKTKMDGKIFMVNSPLPRMKIIMEQSVGSCSRVYKIGDRYKIAKPEVNPEEFSEDLPDNKAAVIETDLRMINHAPNVGGSVAVLLDKLAGVGRRYV